MQEKQNLLLFNVYVGRKQRKDKQMMFLLLGKQEKKKMRKSKWEGFSEPHGPMTF